MNLVIVESPAKCKTIEKYLGDGWKVMASVGHIRDLPKTELGVDENLKPIYENTKADVIKKLKSATLNAQQVWLATDLDREGEAIAFHLEEVLKLKNSKRITFNEITRIAIAKAIANPRTIDYALVRAQEARRVADRLVGYRVSNPISQRANDRLSAGRVQSVVVKLVKERDDAIAAFKKTDHFSVRLFFTGEGEWTADLIKNEFISEANPYILDENIIKEIVECSKEVRVVAHSIKPRFQKAPAAFMTDTLQQAASVVLKFPTDKTMKAAQTLYENGLITYHRTDYPNLSVDGRRAVYDYLKAIGKEDMIPETPNLEPVPPDAQEAHEAIRPSDFMQTADHLSEDCIALYKLIHARAVASQMKAAEYRDTSIELEANSATSKGVKPRFLAKSAHLAFEGWRSLTSQDLTLEEKEEVSEQALPDLAANRVITPNKAEMLNQATKPPSKFTEASIIKFLKANGIGRPSTYASILTNITERSYISFEKRQISVTDKGRLVVKLLSEFTFMDFGFTRALEKELDLIANNKANYFDVVSKLNLALSENLSGLEKSSIEVVETNPCPECGKQVNRIKGKYGFFWSCSGFKEGCKFSAKDNRGKMITKEAAKAIEDQKKSNDELTVFDCTCGKGKLIKRAAKKKPSAKQSYWYGCDQFPVCKNTFPHKVTFNKPDFFAKQQEKDV